MTNLTLVLHINAFTRLCESGYLAVRETGDACKVRKVSGNMTPTAAIAWFAEHPRAQIEALYV